MPGYYFMIKLIFLKYVISIELKVKNKGDAIREFLPAADQMSER